MIGKPCLAAYRPSPWALAHATFYGDESASETLGGACGYGNLFNNGYGTDTAALSTTLFNNGVPCVTKGGLRFQFQGNGYWLLVYVMNVGGGGDIANMWVKGSKTGWISMSHNWGASYQAFATLRGQSLSFKVTSYTTKESIICWNVAPANWNLGLTYSTNVNFH
ncbi:hypothetical protein V6N13_086308 [Hibiscus sabdariffa]